MVFTLLDYKENKIKHDQYKNYDVLVNQINHFESMLKNDNYEIIKFFIEINEENAMNIFNRQKIIH